MFPIGFAVQVDPEFPADGGEAVQRIPPGLPRIGAILRIIPADGPVWDVAVGTPTWWRAPHPSGLAVLSDGSGYLVDVREHRVLVEVPGAIRIREDERHDLLLFATHTELTAAGADGIVWRSGDVVDADLKVVGIDGRGIVCTGRIGAELAAEVVLDPRDGSRV